VGGENLSQTENERPVDNARAKHLRGKGPRSITTVSGSRVIKWAKKSGRGGKGLTKGGREKEAGAGQTRELRKSKEGSRGRPERGRTRIRINTVVNQEQV